MENKIFVKKVIEDITRIMRRYDIKPKDLEERIKEKAEELEKLRKKNTEVKEE